MEHRLHNLVVDRNPDPNLACISSSNDAPGRTDVAATESQKEEKSDDSIRRLRASATVDGIHLGLAHHTGAARTVND
jgi:hypothetical protein